MRESVETLLAKHAKYNFFSGHTWLQPGHRAHQYETPFMKFKSTTTLGTFFVFIFGLFSVEMNESGGFPTPLILRNLCSIFVGRSKTIFGIFRRHNDWREEKGRCETLHFFPFLVVARTIILSLLPLSLTI